MISGVHIVVFVGASVSPFLGNYIILTFASRDFVSIHTWALSLLPIPSSLLPPFHHHFITSPLRFL